MQNLAILATQKLGSGFQCLKTNSQKPIRYSEF